VCVWRNGRPSQWAMPKNGRCRSILVAGHRIQPPYRPDWRRPIISYHIREFVLMQTGPVWDVQCRLFTSVLRATCVLSGEARRRLPRSYGAGSITRYGKTQIGCRGTCNCRGRLRGADPEDRSLRRADRWLP